ncbi:nuclease-related domain-containing protein [Bacillus timonensis]|uniref:nuclease-related domain-containing protein n=1 Tax=Bacillus timonensis TaxID=1033734 RepID=UPI0002886FA6|nr:NERD domain-containing protein [Bacillus timonensis]
MRKKELEIPLRIRKLEALLKRLLETQPKYQQIRDEYGRRMSGYRGEQSLQYYLTFLKEKNYLIFHNLRLPDTSGEHFFEIDLLLVSPTFLLIIDAKNYRGELYFDGKFDQLIQTYQDKRKSYHCPVAQINRHQLQLKKLLETFKIPPIPIETLVIFTNPNAIIDASTDFKHAHKVIKSPSFLTKMELFEKRNRDKVLDRKQMLKLSKILLKQHTPNDHDIIAQFNIKADELIYGVSCPNCDKIPMVRTERSWTCTNCNHVSKAAYLNSLVDYSLLFGNTITNQQLRHFLKLPSRTAAKTIFNTLNLEHKGDLKSRIYILPEDIERILIKYE